MSQIPWDFPTKVHAVPDPIRTVIFSRGLHKRKGSPRVSWGGGTCVCLCVSVRAKTLAFNLQSEPTLPGGPEAPAMGGGTSPFIPSLRPPATLGLFPEIKFVSYGFSSSLVSSYFIFLLFPYDLLPCFFRAR